MPRWGAGVNAKDIALVHRGERQVAPGLVVRGIVPPGDRPAVHHGQVAHRDAVPDAAGEAGVGVQHAAVLHVRAALQDDATLGFVPTLFGYTDTTVDPRTVDDPDDPGTFDGADAVVGSRYVAGGFMDAAHDLANRRSRAAALFHRARCAV